MNLNGIYVIENEIRTYTNNRTGDYMIDKGWQSTAGIIAYEIAKETGDTFHICVTNAITGEILRESELAA